MQTACRFIKFILPRFKTLHVYGRLHTESGQASHMTLQTESAEGFVPLLGVTCTEFKWLNFCVLVKEPDFIKARTELSRLSYYLDGE
jgi:hypothetical protein